MENEIKTQVKIEKSSPKLSEFDRKIRRRGFSSSSSSCDSPERSRSPLSDRKSSRKSSRRKRSQRSRHHSRCRSKSRSRTPGHHHRMRYYGTRENPHKSRVVGIFGLSNSSNEATLMDVFAPFGPIEHVQIIYDRQTEKSRGFGFIYFKEIETATKARTTCNGMSLDGKRIRVDYSITKRAHTPTPGIYMGTTKQDSEEKRHRNSHRSSRRSSSRHRSSHRHGSSHRHRHRSRRCYEYSRSPSRSYSR